MIINSTEFNNLLNDSRIDVFFKHHPPGQGLHTVPVTVNLCRGAKTWNTQWTFILAFLPRPHTHAQLWVPYLYLYEHQLQVTDWTSRKCSTCRVGSEEETCYQWIACAVEKNPNHVGKPEVGMFCLLLLTKRFVFLFLISTTKADKSFVFLFFNAGIYKCS